MLLTQAELYLPVSESTLRGVLDESANWENAMQSLSVPEIAALFLLANLHALREHQHVNAERLLAETLETCHAQAEKDGLPAFAQYAANHLSASAINSGFDQLPEFRIELLDDDDVKMRNYISYKGLWDYDFQRRHSEELARCRVRSTFKGKQGSLSAEQSRVYHEFEAQKDEHIHIQGYAGTGKSSLIKSLLGMFDSSGANVLVLAAYKQQLDALAINTKHMQHVHTCTFTTLAEMLIPQDLTSAANLNMLRRYSMRATMPDELIIRQLGVEASGMFGKGHIIKAIRATVYNFCQSGDSNILERHIPVNYAKTFDATLRTIVHQHASELWNALLSPPTADFKPQIRGFHKIKWAALNGWSIPERYTHVMVDECHELPQPILQILACSPQARATLGDDYQNLGGRSFKQNHNIRMREMVHSVRSGHALESIVNPIIAAHPSSMKAQFQGNNLSQLEITYYQKATTPATPAMILVADNWGLFEWVQRLASQNINAGLTTHPESLNQFVQDCFELQCGGSRARHGELFRFNSWDKLVSAYQHISSFRRFHQLLEKGYGRQHWQATYSRLGNTHDRLYGVSLIENVRNMEFDNVMLTSDVFELATTTSKAAFSAKIYVGVTRARRRLFATEKLRHWIEGISDNGAIGSNAYMRNKT